MKIAHLINPLTPRQGSDLEIAQPVTLESLRRAREAAGNSLKIINLAAFYPEDEAAVPDWMTKTPPLTKSSLDHPEFLDKRKLPLLSEIWSRLLEHSHDADAVIYSNIDIAVQPHFYNTVASWIGRRCGRSKCDTPDDSQGVFIATPA